MKGNHNCCRGQIISTVNKQSVYHLMTILYYSKFAKISAKMLKFTRVFQCQSCKNAGKRGESFEIAANAENRRKRGESSKTRKNAPRFPRVPGVCTIMRCVKLQNIVSVPFGYSGHWPRMYQNSVLTIIRTKRPHK